MKKRIRTALLAALFLGLFLMVGCATSGKQFDRTHVNDVKTGVQDKKQIRTWFGKPVSIQSLTGNPAGCTERWTYVHAYASWGGAKSTAAALIVDFNKDGKVCDHAYSEQ